MASVDVSVIVHETSAYKWITHTETKYVLTLSNIYIGQA